MEWSISVKLSNALNKLFSSRSLRVTEHMCKAVSMLLHFYWVSCLFLPRSVCVNPCHVNCWCGCLQMEPYTSESVCPGDKVFSWAWGGLVSKRYLHACFWGLRRKVLNLNFSAGGKTPPFIAVCIELRELIIACVSACVEKECVHWRQ